MHMKWEVSRRGEHARIAEFGHSWRILPWNEDSHGNWTGDYPTAEIALAALGFEQLQHLHELRKDQNFLAIGNQRVEQFKKCLRFSGRRVAADE